MTPLPQQSSVCLISARRYGDAIIHAAVLKQAALARADIKWIIWTKPEFTPLFKLMGFHNVIAGEFPIAGGHKKLISGGWKQLFRSVMQLRKLKIDASVDFIGDTRETFLGSIIGSKNHYSPRWGTAHWMRKLIWNISMPSVSYLPVSDSNERVYNFIPDLLSEILGEKIAFTPELQAIQSNPKIAFHPFSSQSFKKWPTKNWTTLSRQLSGMGSNPVLLCSTAELDEASQSFGLATPSLPIHACSSIEELVQEINGIDLLIGVDSFLVHLASALGKRTIVLNAGNKPHWWQPPNSIALGQSGDCANYPCMNEPSCLGKANESACIRSINPDSVMNAVKQLASLKHE